MSETQSRPRAGDPHSREFAGLVAVSALVFAVTTMSDPLIPLIGTELGASPGGIGAVMGLAGLFVVPLTVPTGLAIRTAGTRRILIAAGVAAMLGFLVVARFSTFFWFSVVVGVREIARMMMIVAIQTHVAILSGKDSSSRFGHFGAAASVGQMIGPVIGGVLIDTLGASATWAIMAALLAGVLVATHFLIGRGHTASSDTGKFSIRELAGVRTVSAIACAFLLVMAGGARLVLLPIFLSREGFSATFIGAVFSVRALVSTLARLGMGPIIKGVGGRFRTLILFLAVYAVGVGTTTLCRTPVLLVLNVLLVGVGIAIVMPLTMATVADSVRKEDRSVAMSVRLAGNRLGQVVGPLGYGALSDVVGIPGALFAAGGIMLAGTVAVALWWRGR